MKRGISILALFAIVATGAFAQWFPPPMSAGGGLLFDWSGGNGTKMEALGRSASVDVQNLSFGGFGFFDATYAELDVNFAYGLVKYNVDMFGPKTTEDANALQLGFTLLGKYPISLAGLPFTFFPLLGVDYNLVLSVDWKDGKSEKNPGDWSQFGLLAGAGLDYPLTSALYLRGEALFHIRFANKAMSDGVDEYKKAGISAETTLGLGPRIKIGVGYRFGGSSGSGSGNGGGTGSASQTPSQAARYMLVNTDTLNVRSGASADTALVGTLTRNTRVEVLDSSGTWWRIRSGNITGYVNSSYLKAE